MARKTFNTPKNGKQRIVILTLILIILFPIFIFIYWIIISLDNEVEFVNETSEYISLSIRQGIAVQKYSIKPFKKHHFRPREGYNFSLYASFLADDIESCGTNYPYNYNDDYTYVDDPCCILESNSCTHITRLKSLPKMKIYYSLDVNKEGTLKIKNF